MESTQKTVHRGGCHCGAVQYDVTMATPEKAFAGNCSICQRAGWLLAFVGADDFRLVAGEDKLTDYQFGKMRLHHQFCSVCGVRSFSRGTKPDGSPMYAVNLRCVANLDTASLPVELFDCAKL